MKEATKSSNKAIPSFPGKSKAIYAALLLIIMTLGASGLPHIPQNSNASDSTNKYLLIEKLLLEYETDGVRSDYVWPPIWDELQPNWQAAPHFIIVTLAASPRINNISLEGGDYIGGFYTDDNGDLKCGGAKPWNDTTNISIGLRKDDYETPEKDGFVNGEQIYFKFFSWTTLKDYDVDIIDFDEEGAYSGTDKWGSLNISVVLDMQALVDLDFYINANENPICLGHELYLSAEEFVGTSGPYSFNWSSNPPGFSSNQKAPPPTIPLETTTYLLTVDDGLFTSEHELSIIVADVPQADAGEDATVAAGAPFALNGTALNYDGVLWESSGDGNFDDPNSLATSYSPGNADIANGYVQISLTAFPIGSCPNGANDDLTLQVLTPLADELYLNCQDYDFENEAWLPVLLDIETGPYSSIGWFTMGDGYFDNPASMPTHYNLGPNDINEGEVSVFLKVNQPNSSAVLATVIYIPRQLIQIENTGTRGISSYLDLSSVTMPDAFEPIAECLQIIYNADGESYNPATGINQIGNWLSEGYITSFDCDCCLPLYGEMLEDRTFEVSGPYIYLPVLSDFPVDIQYLFAGHLNEIQSIYDMGTEEYWTPSNPDFTSLGPGKAYLLTTSNSGVNFTIEFPSEELECNPWSPTPTSITHTISVPTTANPNIDGEPISEGDWIGVFYIDDAGGLKCGGTTQWETSTNITVIAYADDPLTQEKEGFANGEQLRWRIFNCSEREEYSAYATYDMASPNNSGLFSPFGVSNVLTLESAICQQNSFTTGWNGVSLYIKPNDLSVENIFAPFQDDLVLMRNLTSVYWPSVPVNTINDWDITSGYAIKFSSDLNIEFCGGHLNSREVSITAGWHYLPVLSECPVSAAEVFGLYNDDIILVREVAGTKVYWPGPGIFTLQELMPGNAYMINTSADITITFPECAKQSGADYTTTNNVKTIWGDIQNMPNAHLVSIPMHIVNEFSHSDLIGVFDAHGNCFGVHEFSNAKEPAALIINGDDLASAEKDGFTENESLEFRLWKAETGEESLLEVSFDQSMPNSEMIFTNNGLSAITDIGSVANGLGNSFSDLDVKIAPNPAKDNFLLSIDTENFSKAELTIYKLNGQKADAKQISGCNTNIDISNLAPGIYILNLQLENTVINKRLVKH